jgi:hypothetical protein
MLPSLCNPTLATLENFIVWVNTLKNDSAIALRWDASPHSGSLTNSLPSAQEPRTIPPTTTAYASNAETRTHAALIPGLSL